VLAGAAGVAGVGGASLLAACGTAGSGTAAAPAAQAPQGTASYMSVNSGSRVEHYKQLAAKFHEKYPKAEIEILGPAQGENLNAKVIAMAAGGTPPETMFMAGYSLVQFAEQGLVEPLDALVSRDKIDMKGFFEQTVQLSKWKIGGKEQLFAIPLHPNPVVLFYNKDLFAKRGVKAPDATWTWETLLDNAKKLASPDEAGIEAPYQPIPMWPTIRSMGGDILDSEWKKYTLDQPAATAAVQWIADLALRHQVAALPKEVASRQFTQGKVAMKWDIFPTIDAVYVATKGQFAFDVAPLPKGPKGRINRNVIGAYSLLKNAKNEALGWEWIKWLSTKEPHLFMANSGDVFPALKEAARSPEFLNAPPPTPQVNRKVFLDALEQDTLIQDPYIPTFDQVQSLVVKALAPVWDGAKDARTALQEIGPQVTALLAGN
jgi:multiple sugar transport system substrate-binding protein